MTNAVPLHGKHNQPAYVVEVAKKFLVSICATSVAEIARQSGEKFLRLFPQ